MNKTYYMNILTGNVDDYDGWFYVDENNKVANAVDRGEVIEVVQDVDGAWCEVYGG